MMLRVENKDVMQLAFVTWLEKGLCWAYLGGILKSCNKAGKNHLQKITTMDGLLLKTKQKSVCFAYIGGG